jgi:hypothetical protein
VGFREHGNEHSDSIKSGNFLNGWDALYFSKKTLHMEFVFYAFRISTMRFSKTDVNVHSYV